MYICICNALRDRDLASAADGARGVSEVFRRCGQRPQCGKCVPDVVRMVEAAAQGKSVVSASGTK